jgi:hypothetical protein
MKVQQQNHSKLEHKTEYKPTLVVTKYFVNLKSNNTYQTTSAGQLNQMKVYLVHQPNKD